MSALMSHPTPVRSDQDFKDAVLSALQRMSSASAELVAAAGVADGGRTIRRATDLQRVLKIPYTLAWQVFRVANAGPGNLLAEADTVPGTKAVRRLIRAAEERGIKPESLEALNESAQAFEVMVRDHAGDRKTFNSIVGGLSESDDAGAALHYRRAAFQANSHIWGSQLQTKLVSLIIHPMDDELVSMLAIGGTIDLVRLHGDLPYELSKSAVHDDSPLRKPNDVVATAHPLTTKELNTPGSTVLTEFCSRPMPTIRNYVDEDKLVVELSPAGIGWQQAVTAFTCELFTGLKGRFWMEDAPTFGMTGYVKSPAVTWIVDFVIAAGTFGPDLPKPRAYTVRNLGGKPILFNDILRRYEADIVDRPPVVYLGKGPGVLETDDVPRYPEMLEHVCGKLGWDPSGFDVLRCRVEYPVLPSSVAVGFDLPEKAGAE